MFLRRFMNKNTFQLKKSLPHAFSSIFIFHKRPVIYLESSVLRNPQIIPRHIQIK